MSFFLLFVWGLVIECIFFQSAKRNWSIKILDSEVWVFKRSNFWHFSVHGDLECHGDGFVQLHQCWLRSFWWSNGHGYFFSYGLAWSSFWLVLSGSLGKLYLMFGCNENGLRGIKFVYILSKFFFGLQNSYSWRLIYFMNISTGTR